MRHFLRMDGRRKYRRPNTKTAFYGKYGSARTRKGYNAQQRQKAMVVTTSRTTNSANRVGGDGLDRISTGRFRNLPTLWPDRFMCKMKLTFSQDYMLPSNQQSYIRVFVANGLETPSSVPGYAELGGLYKYNLVHATKHTVTTTVDGNNTNGLLVTHGFLRNSPPWDSFTSHATLLNTLGNPYTVWSLLGSSGKNAITLENYVSMSKLAGMDVKTDADYAAQTNSEPFNRLFAYMSVSTPITQSAAIGFTQNLEAEFYMEFYGRNYVYQ